MSMQEFPVDPRQRAWDLAMAYLSPEENKKALAEGVKNSTERQMQEFQEMLENGTSIYENSQPAVQWQAIRDLTFETDINRVLLNDAYFDNYAQGIEVLPDSQWWAVWVVLGETFYEHYRKIFIRNWNREMRRLGRNDLVYSGGSLDPQLVAQPTELETLDV